MTLYHRPDKCDQVQARVRQRLRGQTESKKLEGRSHALYSIYKPPNDNNTISINKLEHFKFPLHDIEPTNT